MSFRASARYCSANDPRPEPERRRPLHCDAPGAGLASMAAVILRANVKTPARFRDRADAGRQLAQKVAAETGDQEVLVLGLPRGGVPVAHEVAQQLGAELDVFLVRKLGVPGHEELAMGAIAADGVRVLNEDVVQSLRIPAATIEAVASAEQAVLASREREYRGQAHRAAIRDRTVILVDDGLATGASMRAAILALRMLKPRAIIVAVPVAPVDTCAALEREADRVVCLSTPAEFHGVGEWYEDFSQTTDEEVRALLARSQSQHAQRCGLRLPRGQGQP